MTKEQVIRQLEDLKAHCESMRNPGNDEWDKDVKALEMAIEIMRGSISCRRQ